MRFRVARRAREARRGGGGGRGGGGARVVPARSPARQGSRRQWPRRLRGGRWPHISTALRPAGLCRDRRGRPGGAPAPPPPPPPRAEGGECLPAPGLSRAAAACVGPKEEEEARPQLRLPSLCGRRCRGRDAGARCGVRVGASGAAGHVLGWQPRQAATFCPSLALS